MGEFLISATEIKAWGPPNCQIRSDFGKDSCRKTWSNNNCLRIPDLNINNFESYLFNIIQCSVFNK